jgi:hypothetical protein
VRDNQYLRSASSAAAKESNTSTFHLRRRDFSFVDRFILDFSRHLGRPGHATVIP